MSEDKIITKLLEHDEKLAEMATKNDLSKLTEEFLSGQDAIMTILKRLDEERAFTHKWVKDIEQKVEENTHDLKKIKLQFKIA